MDTAKGWIYSLATLFGLGILYITIVEFAIAGHLKPALEGTLSGLAIAPLIISKYDHILVMLRVMPFVIFFCVVIYMLVLAIRKEGESQYGGY